MKVGAMIYILHRKSPLNGQIRAYKSIKGGTYYVISKQCRAHLL